MATVVQIRAGLRTRLATISGLRTPKGFDRISVPAAHIGEVEGQYNQTFGSSTTALNAYQVKVRLYVSRASDSAAEANLDAYLAPSGAQSVKAALEGDRTLGGVAETLNVSGFSGYGVYEVADQPYVGAEFTVDIYARGGS